MSSRDRSLTWSFRDAPTASWVIATTVSPPVRLALAAILAGACVAPAAPSAGSLVTPAAVAPSVARRSEATRAPPPDRTGPQPDVADLPYAGEAQAAQTLDLYLPPPGSGGALAPLVIWIHGGGFRLGDKRSMRRRSAGPPPRPTGPDGPYQIQVPDVAALTAKGYAVASINYRLGASMAEAAVPAIHDGKTAVRFLRANAGAYHLDPDRFAVWGNSAGGYMAAMLGVTGDQRTVFDAPKSRYADVSSAVQAAVVWFGAEDRLPGRELSIAGNLHAGRNLPAFMIANGDADPIISPGQARRLHDALLAAGARSTLVILPGAGHEDPAFTATQMLPTIAFLEGTFGR
jgi:acetyl esterase/lipase